MKERGSMCEQFPLCGSAWAAIWGQLLKKPFCTKHRLSDFFTFFYFFGRWFWVFPKRFRWVCKDFGLEPWRKMMRRGQLSILSNQINSNSIKLISFTGICQKSVFRKNNIIIPIIFPYRISGLPIHPSEGCLFIPYKILNLCWSAQS